MTLLQQTIQEYLNEHHKEWQINQITTRIESAVYLISELEYTTFKPIYIHAISQTIRHHINNSDYTQAAYTEEPYTEQTLLPQITKLINTYTANQ